MATSTEGKSLMLSQQERSSIIQFVTAMGGDASDFATTSGRRAPKELNVVINKIMQAIAQDRPISITTMPKELTTTNAAAILGISRPTLMKQIRNGRIKAHKVGSHHRLHSRDVLDLADRLKEEQRQAVFDLMDLDEAAGKGA